MDSNKPDPNESDADLQEVAPEVSALREVSVRRKWLLVSRGLLRAAGTATLMVALYYVLPLDQRSHTFLFFEFACGIMLLIAIVSWQVRAIVRAKYPGIRATQALATAVPLFLLVFAATYFVLSFDDPATFSEPLSRSDALYFTVTVFATVGIWRHQSADRDGAAFRRRPDAPRSRRAWTGHTGDPRRCATRTRELSRGHFTQAE